MCTNSNRQSYRVYFKIKMIRSAKIVSFCPANASRCLVRSTNICLNPVVLKELVSAFQTWYLMLEGLFSFAASEPFTVGNEGIHFYPPYQAQLQDGWRVGETVPLYPDTAINTHEAMCHAASSLNGGSHASYDTSVRAHALCPHTKRWCGSSLNNLCFFTGVIG